MKVIPTVLEKTKPAFMKRLNILSKISKDIQIDIMDGKFVKSKSVQIKNFPNLKSYKNIFEAHLMTENPENYIKQLKNKGFKRIIFHIEATKNPEKTVKEIKKEGMQPIITLTTQTPKKLIKKSQKITKTIMVMGIKPGSEHQELSPKIYPLIRNLKKAGNTRIQVDGGVNDKTAKKLKAAGTDILTSGSYIYNSKNRKEAYLKLKRA